MKKKQFKFKGVVLACCLAASMPLGITTPFEISAMADVVAHNVDITPPAGTTDKASHIKTVIENALAAHDIIRVSGNAQMEPTANSIEITIPQQQPQQPQTPGTQQQPQQPDTQPNKPQQNQTPEKKPNKPQTPEKQPQIPQQPEKKKPSDIVTPGKSGSEDNKAHGKATPSVPKKPDNSGGGRRKGRNSGGGSGRGSSRDSKKDKSAKNNNKPLEGTWINDAKGWWYKEPNGAYPKSTWKQIDYNGIKNWYYFDEQGYMATGWKLINDKWYYMYENTEKGHIKGSMAYSTKVGEYKIGFDGAWIK